MPAPTTATFVRSSAPPSGRSDVPSALATQYDSMVPSWPLVPCARPLVRAGRRGRRVALADRRRDSLAARARIERVVPLDLGRLLRELGVLDHVTEPDRVVARPQVVLPRAVVDALRDLQEQHQVLRAQAELAPGTAKIEAAVVAEVAFRVLE